MLKIEDLTRNEICQLLEQEDGLERLSRRAGDAIHFGGRSVGWYKFAPRKDEI